MLKHIGMGSVAAAVVMGALFASPAVHADTQPGVKVGVLTCNVSSGWGIIFGSSRHLNCTYSSGGGHEEHYSGRITKFGVDIGYTHGGVMVWAVFAPSTDLAPGALAGPYGGATAGASVGVGAQVNALVGGFNKSVSLQPVSIEGVTGLNVAAGVAEMRLKLVP